MDWNLTGGFNPSFFDTSYDAPLYDGTITQDIATQGAAVQTAPADSGWGDIFKSAFSGLVEYSIKKDAAQTGIQLQRQAQTAPQYYAPSQGSQGNPSGLLLIAGAVIVALMVSK